MSEPVPPELTHARERFGALVADLRPELHRYCSRMVGSVIDGEDVVQDALGRAYYALSMMRDVPNLRPWLFRIAHNKAIDHLRARARREADPLDNDAAEVVEEVPLAERELAAMAMSLYLQLTALQRSCVILKDVLGYSLEEIAETIHASISATKAALHRGRAKLRELGREGLPAVVAPNADEALLARYVDRFNARDWDGVRNLLANDVRVELVDRGERIGREQSADYFKSYNARADWRLALGRAEGRLVVIAYEPACAEAPAYLADIRFDESGSVAFVRDFCYARDRLREVHLGEQPRRVPVDASHQQGVAK